MQTRAWTMCAASERLVCSGKKIDTLRSSRSWFWGYPSVLQATLSTHSEAICRSHIVRGIHNTLLRCQTSCGTNAIQDLAVCTLPVHWQAQQLQSTRQVAQTVAGPAAYQHQLQRFERKRFRDRAENSSLP